MLEKKIQDDLFAAMKSHDEVTVAALRSIKTAIQNEKTNGKFHELTDDEIVKLIQKLSKQRQEAADIYNQANRLELAQNELNEKYVLDGYLPSVMNEDELKEVIDKITSALNATTMKDMGRVMKELSAQYPNQYDGRVASNIIKSKLMN